MLNYHGKMIRLKNHVTELDRLLRIGRFEEAQTEFNTVCGKVFGLYLSDLFPDECERLVEMVASPGAAIFLVSRLRLRSQH